MESMLPQAAWPELQWDDWSATADTLHMWTQIVGKTRLALQSTYDRAADLAAWDRSALERHPV